VICILCNFLSCLYSVAFVLITREGRADREELLRHKTRTQRCIDRTCLGTFDTTTGTGWRLWGIRATYDIVALHIIRNDDGNAVTLDGSVTS